MVDNTVRMYESLLQRNYPDLALEYHLFDGETHTSVAAQSIVKGIQYVLNTP